MSLFTSLGGGLNNLMGTTSAAKQSQLYALQSGAINNAYQKEFAKNAHLWEIQDLKRAGLNPVLSAGGSGTSASGGGVSAGTVSASGANPLTMAMETWQGAENANYTSEMAKNTAMKTNETRANVENINQDTVLKRWQTITEMEKGKLTASERAKLDAEKKQIVEMTPYVVQNEQMRIGLQSAQTEEALWNAKHTKKKTDNGTGYSASVNTPMGGGSFSKQN